MATGLWTDYKASSFAGGSGTSSSPYQISNAAQLAYMAYLVNSNTTYRNKYYLLHDRISTDLPHIPAGRPQL